MAIDRRAPMLAQVGALCYTHRMSETKGLVIFDGQPNPYQLAVYSPRRKTDHHPWHAAGQPLIRYANFEVFALTHTTCGDTIST